VGSFAFRDSGLSGALALPNLTDNPNLTQFIFSGTNITSVDLSAMTGLTGITSYAFQDCKNLQAVVLPSGLASFTIGAHAFRGCESLDTLNWDAFSAGSLTVAQNGLFTDTAFSSLPPFDIFTSKGFPGAVNMPNLVSVDLTGNSGTSVSFQNCANLESLTLNAALTSISTPGCPRVLYNLGSNTNFTGDAGSTGNVMLFKDSGTTLVAVSGAAGANITIPAGVTAMPMYIFQNTTDLVSVDMSGCSLSSVPMFAFQGCTALEEVIFSASTTTISAYAFLDCTALTEVTLPAGLTHIEAQAFSNCGIEVITLPPSLSNINGTAFRDSPLKTVKIPYDLEAILQSTSFSGVVYELLPGGGSGGYEVFADRKLVVKDHEVLFVTPEFSGALVLPASVTAIAPSGFYFNTGVSSVDMSACTGMTTIANYAFYGATALTSVTFPASLTTIGMTAFGDTGLTSADLSACPGMTTIGQYVFRRAASLSSVTVPASLTSLGYSNFNESGLTSVDLSVCAGMTSIDYGAFTGAAALTSVTLPASLTTIAAHAFNGTALGLVDLSGYTNLTSIGDYAFYNTRALTTVTFPNSLETIGQYAFSGSSALGSITLPASLTTIGEGAFQTSGLVWVKWPASPATVAIGNSAFNGASKLIRAQLPDNLSFIGNSAFASTPLQILILAAAAAPALGTTPFPATAFDIYVPDTSVAAYQAASGWSEREVDIMSIKYLSGQNQPGNW
jgi:Leucine-rich repeat (LRR) protein